MKTKVIASALLIGALISTGSAQTAQRECEQDGLHGNVKKVSSTMYEALVDRDGDMQYGSQLERTETIYNEKGQRRSMTFLSADEDDMLFRSRYKHDGFGLMTLEHIVDNHEQIIGRTYYIYDKNLVLSESYVEDAERQIEHRVLYKYDESGRLKQRSYNDAKNNVYRREVYGYDFDGAIHHTSVFDRSNSKILDYHYEYDSHMQPINVTTYDYTDEDADVSTTLYQYKYDDHGNWIQKTQYTLEKDNATPTFITNRRIEYFD
ncbi:MAG: hypothetical protein J5711_04575 [Bacteroidales bacterium]|nr:hypothetical protein [Bacteroidales bacterium]